jgi:hypothetical protein
VRKRIGKTQSMKNASQKYMLYLVKYLASIFLSAALRRSPPGFTRFFGAFLEAIGDRGGAVGLWVDGAAGGAGPEAGSKWDSDYDPNHRRTFRVWR